MFLNNNRSNSSLRKILSVFHIIIIIGYIDNRSCAVNCKFLGRSRSGNIIDLCTRIICHVCIGNVECIIAVCTISQSSCMDCIIPVSGSAVYRPAGNCRDCSVTVCQHQTYIIRVEITFCHFNRCCSCVFEVLCICCIRTIVIITDPDCRGSYINLNCTICRAAHTFVSGTVNCHHFNNNIIAVVQCAADNNIC